MDPKRKAFLGIVVFVVLLGFHLWLLTRTIARKDVLLSVLLGVAITVFLHRIAYYALQYRRGDPVSHSRDPSEQIRRIRKTAPVVALLLSVHVGVFLWVFRQGELLFSILLLVAIVTMASRLGYYGYLYGKLTRTAKEPATGQ